MLSPLELAIRTANTKRFIDADPTEIVLTPKKEVMKGGTKFFQVGKPRPRQKFKVIWAGDNGIVRSVDEAGGVRRFNFILVGNPDAQVEIGDFWRTGSQLFVIEYQFPSLGYEVKVGGNSHGADPTQ